MQCVVLGLRGPWFVTFETWLNISSRNKIRRKVNVRLFTNYYSFIWRSSFGFLVEVKAWNQSLLTGTLICLSWSLDFSLLSSWINKTQREDVPFWRTGFQINLFLPLEARARREFSVFSKNVLKIVSIHVYKFSFRYISKSYRGF